MRILPLVCVSPTIDRTISTEVRNSKLSSLSPKQRQHSTKPMQPTSTCNAATSL